MSWTAAIGGELCGLCTVTFASGDAMFVSPVSSKILRCPTCRPEIAVDWAAVEAARERHALNREASAAGPEVTRPGAPKAPVMTGFTQVTSGQLNDVLERVGGIRGVRRTPKSFASVADDPVIARLCEESNR